MNKSKSCFGCLAEIFLFWIIVEIILVAFSSIKYFLLITSAIIISYQISKIAEKLRKRKNRQEITPNKDNQQKINQYQNNTKPSLSKEELERFMAMCNAQMIHDDEMEQYKKCFQNEDEKTNG